MWTSARIRVLGLVGLGLALAAAVAAAPAARQPLRVSAELLPTPTVSPILSAQAIAQAGSAGQIPVGVVAAGSPAGGSGGLALVAATATSIPALAAPCADTPADWIPYRVQQGDTTYHIAVVYGTTIAALVRANCLTNPRLIHVGQTLFVPPERYAPGDLPPQGGSSSLPQSGVIGGSSTAATVPDANAMPIAITHFTADRPVSDPGQTVRLTWSTQGPVNSVQLGWLHQGTVIPERSGLPASGVIDVNIPADGRRTMPFVLQVSDGTTVASAFATVAVNCAAGWVFQPAPADVCPYEAVAVRTVAQQFERGLVVYLAGLDRLYAFFNDGEWLAFRDAYRPGMPFHDPTLVVPADRWQPEGAIGYLWRTEPSLAERLGWATHAPVAYNGLLQRAAYPDHDVIYLGSSGGQLFVLAEAMPWQTMTPVVAQ